MNAYFPAELSRAEKKGFWTRIHPGLRLLSFFVFLFLIFFTSASNWLTFASLFFSLGLVAILGGFSWKFFGRSLALSFPWLAFVSIALLLRLKSISGETGSIMGNLLGKTILTLMLLGVYKKGITLSEAIGTLRQAKIPPLFVSLLFLSAHFIQVLGEEAQRINRAFLARSGEKISFHRKTKILWSLMNSLFDRAFGRSQQLLAALLSRGFTGRLEVLATRRLTSADFLFLLSLFLLTIGIFWLFKLSCG